MKQLHLILVLAFAYCGSVYAQSPPIAVLSDIPTQESMNAWKSKEQDRIEKYNKVCANEAYKLYFAKTPCFVGELTLQHLADNSYVTPAEKNVLLVVDNELLAQSKISADNFRENVKPASLGAALAMSRMKARADGQENLINLYNGKITWGGYNTQRKALAASSRADYEKIVKDNAPQR